MIKSLVLSNTTPRQARSLSRGRLSHSSSRPASAVIQEDSETNSSDRGRCRGRIQYRQPRSQSVAVSSNQVLPWSLSKVKISETESYPRKQVTFLPTWQILQPTSPKVQLVSYEDLRSTKELKKQPW